MVQAHQDSRDEGTTNLFPLKRLKRFGMGPQILKTFYSCTIESILMGCITAWYGKALHGVVHRGQYITGAKLPAIQDLYTRRCQRKALKLVKVSSLPRHRLFSSLACGKHYWSTKSMSKILNSLYPQAKRLLTI